MRYYKILQDYHKSHSIKIEELYMQEEAREPIGIAYFTGKEEAIPDYIHYKENQLISKGLKDVIEMYTDDVAFTPIILSNKLLKIQKEFYRLEVFEIEGLSEKTTYYKNGWIDQAILNQQKIGDYQIFKVKELKESYVFVHLDIVESILRRNLWGMKFEQMKVKNV